MAHMKTFMVLAFALWGVAHGTSISGDSLLSGVGDALLSSLSTSSLGSMQAQFSEYLTAMDGSLLSKTSSLTELMPDLSGWNLSSLIPDFDFDLEASVEDFHDKYCDGIALSRGGKVPTVLLGPELNITLDTGNCTLVWSDDYKNKSVVCTGPAVSYVKTPATLVVKHFKAASISIGSCVFKKEYSSGSEKVLYSGGNDIIFQNSKDFQDSVSSGAFKLWDVAVSGSSADSGNSSLLGSLSLVNLLPSDWSIVQQQ